MTDKPALASQPDKFEQLLADLEGKYDKPDPGNIALGANRFEQILNSVILPFVGVNAFLFGGIALRQIYPEYVLSLFLSYLSAAVLLLAWIYRHRNRTTEIPTVFLSAAPTFLIAAALTFPLPIASSVVVLLVTCVFAILVYTSRIPQTAVPLYAIYLPILLERILADQVLRIVVESLTLLPMGILFIRRKFRVATSAVVVSAVLTGALESSSEGYSVPVIALLLILVCFAIWYEVRIAKADYSASRMTLDHGLLVLLAYLALYAFRFASSDRLIWTWALTILVYQAVQSARERLSDPTRVAATAIPLTIALWMTDAPLPAAVQVGGALFIAALVNIAALHFRNTLLSTIGFLLLIPGAVKLFTLGDSTLSATVVVLGLATTLNVLLIARRPAFPALTPWWQGFIKKDHLDWSKGVLLMIGGTLLKIPLATFVFKIFHSTFLWLRYFKGKGQPFGVSDILYVAAHFYGVIVMSRQLQLWLALRNTSANTQLSLTTAVWVLWGLAVFASGGRHHTIYQRFVGIAFVLAPAALYYPAIEDGDAPLALVSMVIGAALWIVGIMNEIRKGFAGEIAEEAAEKAPIEIQPGTLTESAQS